MSVAVRRALYGKLAGDTTLTNMLGSAPSGFSKSIYFEQAPETAGFPYVIFTKSSGIPTYTMSNGGAAFNTEIWMLKGVDRNTTADKADAIASRLDALLTDGTLSISGYSLMYLRRESDVQYPETKDGVLYLHSGATFRLIYQPS